MTDNSGGKPSDKLMVAVYSDLASPGTREIGSAIGGVVRSALSPVNLAVLTFDQAYAWAAEAVAKKFEERRTPADRIVAADPSVALPAIAAIQTADSELRDLFANLIASSLDSITASAVHPAYVDLLRQLAPADARVLATIYRNPGWHVLEVEVALTDNSIARLYATTIDHLGTTAGLAKGDNVRMRVENLARLGLIQRAELVPFGRSVAEGSSVTSPFFDDAAIDSAIATLVKNSEAMRARSAYRLATTDFGEALCKCCIADHDFGSSLIAQEGGSIRIQAVLPLARDSEAEACRDSDT